MDNIISSGSFTDLFMDMFGRIANVFEHCGIYISVFLFFKLNIDVVVMINRHLEITKTTGESLGFSKTVLCAYDIFVMSFLNSKYDSRASTFAAVEEESKILCNGEELSDMRDDV